MVPVRRESTLNSGSEEVIFRLIPDPEPVIVKPPRYISKMGWKTPPTASTFGPASTSQLNVTNLDGSFYAPYQTHIYKKPKALFGHGNRTVVDPKHFLKKPERASSAPGSLPQRLCAQRHDHQRKVPIPKKHDRPIYGLVSKKNFIKANAIEIMLSEPVKTERRLPSEYPGYHSSYGKVPEYLHGVKREIAIEYEYLDKLKSRDKVKPSKEEQLIPLNEEERLALLNSLKSKWNDIQHQYQGITHHVILDTIGQVRKKEKYERDLTRLEADIETLSKQNVLVRTS